MFELTGIVPVLLGLSVMFGGALAIHSAGRMLFRWTRRWRPVFPAIDTATRGEGGFRTRFAMDIRSFLIGLGRVTIILVVSANIILWAVAAYSASSFTRALFVPV